jgi:hypothetical protein
MTDEAATDTPPAESAPEAAPAAAAVAEPLAAAASAPEDVASLPDWAQKLIGKTRSEAAGNRAKANENAQALEATRDAIAKALGLKGDDDPVQAALTAAEQRDAALSEVRQAKVENAVLMMAERHGADPIALTDSRSFMRATEGLDPSAEDFTAKVEDAIKTALEANPLLKSQAVAPAPPARSGGPVGGGAAVPGQLTQEDVKTMTPAEIVKAKEDGRLNQLLGIAS